ncbi:MAG: hypothetical protein GY711_23490 [bacterium]|nr:hypothetical protein [bacterium]
MRTLLDPTTKRSQRGALVCWLLSSLTCIALLSLAAGAASLDAAVLGLVRGSLGTAVLASIVFSGTAG